MLNGSLVVPDMRGGSESRFTKLGISREFPYGKPPPDKPQILYVCHNIVHRDLVAHTFRDRAMYSLVGAALTGRAFDHIVFFDWPIKLSRNDDWEAYHRCNLRPNGTISRYTMEQQYDLGIYKYVGFDLASDYIAERKQLLEEHGSQIFTQGEWPKGT